MGVVGPISKHHPPCTHKDKWRAQHQTWLAWSVEPKNRLAVAWNHCHLLLECPDFEWKRQGGPSNWEALHFKIVFLYYCSASTSRLASSFWHIKKYRPLYWYILKENRGSDDVFAFHDCSYGDNCICSGNCCNKRKLIGFVHALPLFWVLQNWEGIMSLQNDISHYTRFCLIWHYWEVGHALYNSSQAFTN